MPLNVQKAIEAGYPLSDIANVLAQESRFDIASARQQGYSDDEIVNALVQQQGRAPSRPGILESGLGGLEKLLSSQRTALATPFGAQEAARAGLERARGLEEKYPSQLSLEAVKQKYEKEGLLPAAGEVLRQAPHFITEQAPQLGEMFAGGRLGAIAGAPAGPVGAGVGAIAGAVAPLILQAYGTGAERRELEGLEPDVLKTGAAAVATAGTEFAATMIPLGGKLVSRMLGLPERALGGKLAEESMKKALAKGAAVGVAAEVPEEAFQQMLERWQANLPLTNDAALKEYAEAAYGATLFGGPFGAGARAVQRGQARKEVAAEEAAAAREKTRQEQEKQREYLQSEEYLLGAESRADELIQERDRLKAERDAAVGKRPGKKDKAGRAAYDEAAEPYNEKLREIFAELNPLQQTLARNKDRIAELKEQARLKELTPEEYLLEQAGVTLPAKKEPEAKTEKQLDEITAWWEETSKKEKKDPRQQALDDALDGLRYFDLVQNPQDVAQALATDPDLINGVLSGELVIPEYAAKEGAKTPKEKADAKQIKQKRELLNELLQQYKKRVGEAIGGRREAGLRAAEKETARQEAIREEEAALRRIGELDIERRKLGKTRTPTSISATLAQITSELEAKAKGKEPAVLVKQLEESLAQETGKPPSVLTAVQNVVEERAPEFYGKKEPGQKATPLEDPALIQNLRRLMAVTIADGIRQDKTDAEIYSMLTSKKEGMLGEALRPYSSKDREVIKEIITQARDATTVTEPEEEETLGAIPGVVGAAPEGEVGTPSPLTARRPYQRAVKQLTERANSYATAKDAALQAIQDYVDDLAQNRTLGGARAKEASYTEDALNRRIRAAKQAYTKAAVYEAAYRRQAEGLQPLTNQQVKIAASLFNMYLNQLILPRKEAQNKYKIFEQLDTVFDRLSTQGPEKRRVEPEGGLRRQGATREAERVAEARGEKEPTLGRELGKREKYVANMVERVLQTRVPSRQIEGVQGVRKQELVPELERAFNKALDVIYANRSSRELLDAVEDAADRSLRGQDVTDVTAPITDALRTLSTIAEEPQPSLFKETKKETLQRLQATPPDALTLSVLRANAANFAKYLQSKEVAELRAALKGPPSKITTLLSVYDVDLDARKKIVNTLRAQEAEQQFDLYGLFGLRFAEEQRAGIDVDQYNKMLAREEDKLLATQTRLANVEKAIANAAKEKREKQKKQTRTWPLAALMTVTKDLQGQIKDLTTSTAENMAELEKLIRAEYGRAKYDEIVTDLEAQIENALFWRDKAKQQLDKINKALRGQTEIPAVQLFYNDAVILGKKAEALRNEVKLARAKQSLFFNEKSFFNVQSFYDEAQNALIELVGKSYSETNTPSGLKFKRDLLETELRQIRNRVKTDANAQKLKTVADSKVAQIKEVNTQIEEAQKKINSLQKEKDSLQEELMLPALLAATDKRIVAMKDRIAVLEKRLQDIDLRSNEQIAAEKEAAALRQKIAVETAAAEKVRNAASVARMRGEENLQQGLGLPGGIYERQRATQVMNQVQRALVGENVRKQKVETLKEQLAAAPKEKVAALQKRVAKAERQLAKYQTQVMLPVQSAAREAGIKITEQITSPFGKPPVKSKPVTKERGLMSEETKAEAAARRAEEATREEIPAELKLSPTEQAIAAAETARILTQQAKDTRVRPTKRARPQRIRSTAAQEEYVRSSPRYIAAVKEHGPRSAEAVRAAKQSGVEYFVKLGAGLTEGEYAGKKSTFRAQVEKGFEPVKTKTAQFKEKDLQKAISQFVVSKKDGTVLRLGEKVVTNPISKEEAQKFAARLKSNLPKNIKFYYTYDVTGIPEHILAHMREQKVNLADPESTVKGGVTPDGSVLIIGNQHESLLDLEVTAAHELIGHYGIDTMLGRKGMLGLLNAVENYKAPATKPEVDEGRRNFLKAAAISVAALKLPSFPSSMTNEQIVDAIFDTVNTADSFISKVLETVPNALSIINTGDLQYNAIEKLGMLGEEHNNLWAGLQNQGEDWVTVESIEAYVDEHGKQALNNVRDFYRTYAEDLISVLNKTAQETKTQITAKTTVDKRRENMLAFARELGVEKYVEEINVATDNSVAAAQARGDSAADIQDIRDNGRMTALREMIARVAEQPVLAGQTTAPAKTQTATNRIQEFIKKIIAALRTALIKYGFSKYIDLNTNDINNLLRQSGDSIQKHTIGAYRNPAGEMVFRKEKAIPGPASQPALRAFADDYIQEDAPVFGEHFLTSAGLALKQSVVDRWAGTIEAARKGKVAEDKFYQMMYYARIHDNRTTVTANALNNGAPVIEQDSQGNYVLSDTGKASVKDMVKLLGQVKGMGNIAAVTRDFQAGLMAYRARDVGPHRLNFDNPPSRKAIDSAIEAFESVPEFVKAREIYNQYNRDLITFLVKAGAITKKLGEQLSKTNYVPYYRMDGDFVVVDFGDRNSLTIGNVKDQPYLHSLIGDNEKVRGDFFATIVQNTSMIVDMGLSNMAAKEVAFSLESVGLLEGMYNPETGKTKMIFDGKGPASKDANIFRFKIDGEDKHVRVATESVGIPSRLIVQGLHGTTTTLGAGIKMLSIPAKLLRTLITRLPLYPARQIVRDSATNYMVAGGNMTPIISPIKELMKMYGEGSEAERTLQRAGALGGQIISGTSEDMEKTLLQLMKGDVSLLAKLDMLAMKADASSRVALYNSYRQQGLSEMQATLAAMESMNFTKRGTSGTLYALNMMVPFLNSQIQGINVLFESMRGKLPYSERLGIQRKLAVRGALLAMFTWAYAAAMQDDDKYKRAKLRDRLNNFFVNIPGVEEPLRIPIPYEAGLIFKALPEAIFLAAGKDEESKRVIDAYTDLLTKASPLGPSTFVPQAVKPILENMLNKSFYTGEDIESRSERALLPEERIRDKTSSAAAQLGKAFGVSPVKVDYTVNAYTGGYGVLLMQMVGALLPTTERPEAPSRALSDLPLVGSMFQPVNGLSQLDTFYEKAEEYNQIKTTFDLYVQQGREKDAQEIADMYGKELVMDKLADKVKVKLGEFKKMENLIRASDLSRDEKEERIKEIRLYREDFARAFNTAARLQ